MADKQDYYETLGIQKGASDDEIKRAYRQMAKKYHPDMNPGDKAAEQKFKEVNEAYSVLSDPQKKAQYDQYGHAAFDGSYGGTGGGFSGFDMGDFGDIFSSFFGGGSSRSRRNAPIDGDSILARLNVSFDEAFFGCKKDVTYAHIERCKTCEGTGAAKGSKPETCQKCGGSGTIRVTQRTMFGVMQSQQACDACGGSGKVVRNPCPDCRGKAYVRVNRTLSVTIPAGIADGQRIALSGQGDAGRNGGSNGDLVVQISVAPHKIFKRERDDLVCEIPIGFSDAALGAEIEVPTMEGTTKYTVPEGTQTGTEFVLRAKGCTNIATKRVGDLRFRVKVEVPKNLNSQQKMLLRQFAETVQDKNSPQKKSFFERIRQAMKNGNGNNNN